MDINQILIASNHCLHLCNTSNIEEIVIFYLIDADALVTNNSGKWKGVFIEKNIACRVIKPNDVKPSEKIVVDCSSLGDVAVNLEKKWLKQARAVCIYNIDNLDPSILKHLVDAHDKMFLSIDNLRVVSHKNLEKEVESLNPEMVESLIKNELDHFIISLLLAKPMSGTELVKILYQKFRVFISPGMLYPALHELEKKGMLKYDYNLKNKVYSVQEREQAKTLLKTHVKVNSLLSQFLVSE